MHLKIVNLIMQLNQSKFFKFISSIRLAVPVMLGIIGAVATGTIFESMYSAEYAKMAVYGSNWFYALMFLLGVNIFASMMSRYPWKKRHTGFVTTHIGILILLFGSLITAIYGVDGSLQIPEGQSNNNLILPRLMVGYQYENSPTLSSVVFDRTLFEKEQSSLGFINDKIGHIVEVQKFIPFASIEKGYSSGGNSDGPVGLSFGLKSQFFDVKEWLHSVDNPFMQMGPATLKLVVDAPGAQNQKLSTAKTDARAKPNTASKKHEKQQVSSGFSQGLRILDVKTKKEVLKIDLIKQQQGAFYKDVQFKIVKVFQHAVVAGNKISENEDPAAPANPAIELSVQKDGKAVREVLYAKYPGFSLNKDGVFGYSFEFITSGGASGDLSGVESEVQAEGHAEMQPEIHGQNPMGSAAGGLGNIIEFHVDRLQPDQAKVVLLKGGKQVAEQVMKEGDSFQTPWMGMKVFLASISFGSEAVTEVKSVKPKAGAQLPQSAIFIKPSGLEQGIWLPQGESAQMQVAGKNMSVVFANESYGLPFALTLEKFTKKDYPGTETPYSYESLVRLETDKTMHLISMNEPLKVAGFTLYQASYIMNPGQMPVTVLSVNRDPGRPIKYLGSIILSLGIIIFTLMKSRLNNSRAQRKSED